MSRDFIWAALFGVLGATGVGLLLTETPREQALLVLIFACTLCLLIVTVGMALSLSRR